MSREHRKYVREQKAFDDRQQATFNPKGKLEKTKEQQAKAEYEIKTNQYVHCPFCLHGDKLLKYLIHTKKGTHKGLGECPECHQKMKFESLTAEWTPEQYAEWCFAYAQSGYWSKVQFYRWKDRLYKLGWSYRFWNKYKQLKGEYTEAENPEYSAERQYEEYMKDQMPGEE